MRVWSEYTPSISQNMKPKNPYAIKCLDYLALQADLIKLPSFSTTDVAIAVWKPRHRCQAIIWALPAFVLFGSTFYFPKIDKRCVFRSDDGQQLVVGGPGEKCYFKITRKRFLVWDSSIRCDCPNDDCFVFRASSEMCPWVVEAAVIDVSSMTVESLDTFWGDLRE